MVVLNITELLHGHKKAEQLVRAGQRVRVVRRGRTLFDLVSPVEPKPGTQIDISKLNRAMSELARKAKGQNLISALRQERDL